MKLHYPITKLDPNAATERTELILKLTKLNQEIANFLKPHIERALRSNYATGGKGMNREQLASVAARLELEGVTALEGITENDLVRTANRMVTEGTARKIELSGDSRAFWVLTPAMLEEPTETTHSPSEPGKESP